MEDSLEGRSNPRGHQKQTSSKECGPNSLRIVPWIMVRGPCMYIFDSSVRD